MPEDFQTPPLNWFRGLKGDAILTPEAISAHVQIQMQLPKEE